MPSHEEHCQHSFKRYGVRGDEIHSWMDEPSSVAGGSHRTYRHDLASLPTAIQQFDKLYGVEMVENIFLDHLKADSEEIRRLEDKESLKSKLWTESDDEYLFNNFLSLSDNDLEAKFQNKSKTEIRRRREHLGLIRPKMMKRNKSQQKTQRIVFNLKKGQTISGDFKVTGGKNDIIFGFFHYQGSVSGFAPVSKERVTGSIKFRYLIPVSGNYCFYFSNFFSVFTSKDISFSYRLENGKEIPLLFSI